LALDVSPRQAGTDCVREQKRAEMIELVSSSFDLERIENAKNAE
jgi:hypothetical protein